MKRQRKEHHDKKGKRKEDAVDVPPTKGGVIGFELAAAPGTARAAGDDNEFALVATSLVVSIPPVFASRPRDGVEELLDSMLMRYIPALRGVVLSHSNLTFLESNAQIKADCPFAVCRVAFNAMVWSPRIGMKLAGKINLCSPDHVSLLIHRTFNTSIPRHHIPIDDWEFEYGPAANDPEFGGGGEGALPTPPESTSPENEEGAMDVDGKGATAAKGGDPESALAEDTDPGGRWVHKTTGNVLGGESSALEFTVVGMTIANQMLSLTGSIQKFPFAVEHRPTAPAASTSTQQASRKGRHEEDDSDEDEDEQENPPPKFRAAKEKTQKPGKEKAKKTPKAKSQAHIDDDEDDDAMPVVEVQDAPAVLTEQEKEKERKRQKKLKRAVGISNEDEPSGEVAVEDEKPKKKKKKRDRKSVV